MPAGHVLRCTLPVGRSLARALSRRIAADRGTPHAGSLGMKNMNLLGLAVAVLMTIGGAPAHAQDSVDETTRRTIVLVHGAFADGSSWDRVVPLLQAKGYKVISLHMPLTSLESDVAAAKRVIASQPGEVVLVGHSYGGMVITEAGNDPKVTGLVYVAAFAPDANESINDLGQGAEKPAWIETIEVDTGGYGRLPLATIEKFFAQGLSRAQTRLILAKQGPVPVETFDAKVKNPAWRQKRSWYVRASQDRFIAPAAQEQMAKRIGATTSSVRSNHLAMIMKPQEIAKVILTAAAAPEAVATGGAPQGKPTKAADATP